VGKGVFGWGVVGAAVAVVFALAARKREQGDVLLLDELDRRRAEATARFYNEVGDSAGF
jgi:hypothetical protein